MDLRDYLSTFRRRWLTLVIATLLGGAAAYGVTTLLTPQYASTSGVFIATAPNNAQTAQAAGEFSQQRVASYADVVSGLEMAQRVVDQLDLDETPEELTDQISVEAVPETVVLRITVTDPDPEQAQAINEAVLEQLDEFVTDLETPPGGGDPLLSASVFDAPVVPTDPVSPMPLINIGLGLVIGLLLGIALAVVRELLDGRVRRVEDVPALRDVPQLGVLAHDSSVPRTPLSTGLPDHAPRTEAYQVLATSLGFIDVDSPAKVLVVTSSVAGEGKTVTAANIAIALAQSGRRTLLVDGDLRRPRVASLFGLESAVGLTTGLTGAADFDECVQEDHATGLHVLASGQVPPNPAALLQSQRMANLIDSARAEYDVVLIDSPPLLPVTDAALLAARADGTLLVLRQGSTTRDQVTTAVERLAAVDASALGLVLTMVKDHPAADVAAYKYEPR